MMPCFMIFLSDATMLTVYYNGKGIKYLTILFSFITCIHLLNLRQIISRCFLDLNKFGQFYLKNWEFHLLLNEIIPQLKSQRLRTGCAGDKTKNPN